MATKTTPRRAGRSARNKCTKQVSARTVRALYAYTLMKQRQEGARRAQCNAAIDDFMNSLYRIAENADVLRLCVMAHLAPVVFALDAQLDCEDAGIELTKEQVAASIGEALAAVKNTQAWKL